MNLFKSPVDKENEQLKQRIKDLREQAKTDPTKAEELKNIQ